MTALATPPPQARPIKPCADRKPPAKGSQKSPKAVANGWLTAEEFADLPERPEGGKRELVQGKVIEMPPVGLGHGERPIDAAVELKVWNRKAGLGRIMVETGYILARDPDVVRGPDISFIRYENIPPDQDDDDYIEAVPDLAVEVMSKNDTLPEVEAKVDEYLHFGVPLVWVLNRRRQTVGVYRRGVPPVILGVADTLDGGDVLPGFSARVGVLFGV